MVQASVFACICLHACMLVCLCLLLVAVRTITVYILYYACELDCMHKYCGTWLSRQPGFSPSLTFRLISLHVKYLVKSPTPSPWSYNKTCLHLIHTNSPCLCRHELLAFAL